MLSTCYWNKMCLLYALDCIIHLIEISFCIEKQVPPIQHNIHRSAKKKNSFLRYNRVFYFLSQAIKLKWTLPTDSPNMKISKCFILKSPYYMVKEMWSKLDYILLNANPINHFNMHQAQTQNMILFIQIILPLLLSCISVLPSCFFIYFIFCSNVIIISLVYIFS